jgi:ADP-heptose:LPS heptosyltransferase
VTRRALVLRALGLGDLLTSVPALRGIRRGLPDHELVLAAPSALAPLVRLAGLADDILDTAPLQPLTWRGPAPEVAVNLHGRGPQSHRLLGALHPGRLVAYACEEVGVAGPRWRADEHEVARWCRLVSDAGWPVHPTDLHLPRPSTAAPVDGAVVVHPGAAYPARRWPPERFAAVARWAADGGWPVVVTGDSAEGSLAAQVARAARLPESCVLAGRTTLDGLAALVSAARLVVCGDTGVAHLATAFATPSVVLFGPVPPSEWGPPAGPHTVVWHGAGHRGDPFGDRVDPALCEVTVEEVVAAAAERLSAPAPGAGARTSRASGAAPR